MNRSDYINKVLTIISNTDKFIKIFDDPFKYLIRLEDKLNRILRSLKSKNIFSEDTYNFLFASGSKPGVLYGLPKTHKTGLPVRPILSALGTFNYNLAKFFVPLLKPLTTNEYTLINSYNLDEKIKQLSFNKEVYLASFDVKDLFTNIPLDETIDLCTQQLFLHDSLIGGLNSEQFKSLLELATKESFFLFDNAYYKQVDGVAMGSPLGPTLANSFLCFHERNWLSECSGDFLPLRYFRYVDDCLLIFDDKSKIAKFLDYLNSQHPNIRFTCELEENSKIAFLDTLIKKNSNSSFSYSVYRKPTFTGLGINYFSFIPDLFKINAIKTLLHRAFLITSDWISFDKEVTFLRNFFFNNGYPLHVFDNVVKRFINRKLVKKSSVIDVPKDIKYIPLPFYGYSTLLLKNELNKFLSVAFPQINFRLILYNNNKLGNFFRLKDVIPSHLCSGVVYEYSCLGCTSKYVGCSMRNIHIRISEHKGRSYRTNRVLLKPLFSEVREHAVENDHPISSDSFKLLAKHLNKYDIQIVESLFIHKKKPDLNNYGSSKRLLVIDTVS